MDFLLRGLQELGIPYREDQIGKVKIYIKELELWNRKLSLVSVQGEELIIRHFLDSLAPFHEIRRTAGEEIADAGSGGGFPGIPLALFMPEKNFFLIERSLKKSTFLSSCALLMELPNIQVIPKPLEEVSREFGAVALRALGQWEKYQRLLYGILEPGGSLFAYKGKREIVLQELQGLGGFFQLKEIVPLQTPFLLEERTLVILKKKEAGGTF